MLFQYKPGLSWFHKLDPITKFIWVICISILSLYYDTTISQLGLLILVVVFGIAGAGLTPFEMWKGLRIPLWFTLPYFALQLLFLPGENVLVAIGSFAVTVEALDYAAAITLRLLILILASMLFIHSTNPRDVVLAAAQKLRVPYRFAFALSIALRFLPILEAEAITIKAAQRLRGLDRPQGLRPWMAMQQRYIFAVFLSAVRRVHHIAEAMELKGFGAYEDRTYRHTITIPFSGKLLMGLSGVSTILGLILL